MSSNTAELTLLIKARNLVDIEMSKVKASLTKLTVTARMVAKDMSDAFKRVGSRIGNIMGNLAQDILTGGNLQTSMLMLGATLAGAAVEGLSARFVPMVLAKVMSTAAFAPLAAAMAAGGATLGSVMATAIAVGAAAFPFVLLALVVAALVYVATNPEFRAKVKAIALEIIGKIGDGLRTLARFLYDRFKAGVDAVARAIGLIPGLFAKAGRQALGEVRAFVNRVRAAIGRIIDRIREAIAWFGSLFSAQSRVNGVDNPNNQYPGFASGGWVGLNGPQVVRVGEEGPEYIVPNHKLGGGGGMGGRPVVIPVMLDGREVGRIMDERLYYLLQRAVPTVNRS